METQTRFNLTAAIQTWHQELAAQPGLAPGDLRELESHLSDAVAELRHHGLSEEESFWLARRRLGSPQPLAEEFVKEDPARAWRHRLFWVALALLMVQLCSSASSTAFLVLAHLDQVLPQRVLFYLPIWLQDLCRWTGGGSFYYLPLVAFLVAFALGPVISQGLANRHFLRGRSRFLFVTTLLVLGTLLVHAIVTRMASAPSSGGLMWETESLPGITCMDLMGIAAWVLPSQANPTTTRVEAD